AGARVALPQDVPERAAYVAAGSVEVGGQALRAGQMAVFAAGVPVLAKATEPAILMAIGGEPVGERFIEWNFVSSSKERIEQAKADRRHGRWKLPVLRPDEFNPLPDAPPLPRPSVL